MKKQLLLGIITLSTCLQVSDLHGAPRILERATTALRSAGEKIAAPFRAIGRSYKKLQKSNNTHSYFPTDDKLKVYENLSTAKSIKNALYAPVHAIKTARLDRKKTNKNQQTSDEELTHEKHAGKKSLATADEAHERQNIPANNDGDTALHLAVNSGDVAAVKDLIAKNVDLSAENDYHQTAVSYAKLNHGNSPEASEIASLLEKATTKHAEKRTSAATAEPTAKKNTQATQKQLPAEPIEHTQLPQDTEHKKLPVQEQVEKNRNLQALGREPIKKQRDSFDDLDSERGTVEMTNKGSNDIENPQVSVPRIRKLFKEPHDKPSHTPAPTKKMAANLEEAPPKDGAPVDFDPIATKKLQNLNYKNATATEVQELVKGGADVNIKDGKGNTPLHTATTSGNIDMVKALLEAKQVNVNARDEKGYSPLDNATANGGEEIVELLLKKGANPNGGNIDKLYAGRPLDMAINTGNIRIIEALLKAKDPVDVNLQNAIGTRALESAVKKGDAKIVNLLLENKANINIPDGHGYTPIINAVGRGHTEIVELILAKNPAVINIKDEKNNTPLDYAVGNEDINLVKLLLQKGADISVSKADPLKFAQKNFSKNSELIKLLKDAEAAASKKLQARIQTE